MREGKGENDNAQVGNWRLRVEGETKREEEASVGECFHKCRDNQPAEGEWEEEGEEKGGGVSFQRFKRTRCHSHPPTHPLDRLSADPIMNIKAG